MKWFVFIFIAVFILVSCQERSIRSIYKKPKKSYIDYIFHSEADSVLCELFDHLEGDYYLYINNISTEIKESFKTGNTDTIWDLIYIEDYDPNEEFVYKDNTGQLRPIDANSFFARLTNRFAVICNKYIIPVTFHFDRQHSYYGNREGAQFSLNPVQITGNYSHSHFIAIGDYGTKGFILKNWYFTEMGGKRILVDYRYKDERLQVINKTGKMLMLWPSSNLHVVKDSFYSIPRMRVQIASYDSSKYVLRGHRWEDRFEVAGKERKDTLYYTYNEAFDDTPFVKKSFVKQIILNYDDLVQKNWKIELKPPPDFRTGTPGSKTE